MKVLKSPAILALAIMLAALSAQATLVTPGSSAIPTGTASIAGATLLATTGTLAFTTPGAGGGSGGTTGTIVASVYRTPTGSLDFTYQVSNTGTPGVSPGISQITGLSFSSPVNVTTDADYVGGTGTPVSLAPITVERSVDGSTVGFLFAPPASANIEPGQTSPLLVVATNATNFMPGLTGVIAGGTANITTYQPASGVPEPAMFLPIGAGLFGLALYRRRRVRV